MEKRYFNQMELAKRWSMSSRTLERWRWLKKGPSYLKLGRKVMYRLEEVEEFESRQLQMLQDVRYPQMGGENAQKTR